jgi:hypothetical protein
VLLMPPSQSTRQSEPHDPLTCEQRHADGTAAEVRLYREAIDLMLVEIEGIEVGYDNGCKGAAVMVGKDALAGEFKGL